jgi:hypothetical protein
MSSKKNHFSQMMIMAYDLAIASNLYVAQPTNMDI